MDRALRIMLVEGSGRGFLSHYVHALASGLSNAGHSVRLVSGAGDEMASWPVAFSKTACLRHSIGDWWRLMREVTRFRPDVVHFQWMHDPFVGRLFAVWLHRCGVATVYTPHNLLPHCGRWIAMPVFGRLYRGMDRVVARDGHMAWAAEEMLGVPPEKIALLPGSPNCIAHPDGPRAAPPELGPRVPGEQRFLFFGHGCERKGLSLLLETAARGMASSVHLVLAGAGVARHIDPPLLERAGQATRITVIDRYVEPDEVAGLFAGSDLLLMPYVKRCSSPILDLAAAFRLPVLRSDRVESSRFRDGVHGMTVASGSARQLHAAIREIVGNRERLSQLRAALAKTESVLAAASRLSESHARMYRDAQASRQAAAPADAAAAADFAAPTVPRR